MNNDKISEDLVNHIAMEFDKIKDKFKMTYDDFNAFSIGYTIGIWTALKPKKMK